MLEELYPTPPELIEKMLTPFLHQSYYYPVPIVKRHRWLDPSAGNGAILEWLREHKAEKDTLFAVEIDPDLRAILIKKGFVVIDYDWLSYADSHSFDVIVMNPPFSNGDDHLMHAWNVLRHGDIVCILNAETIRNPFSRVRQALLALIAQIIYLKI
jgi:methylase of polypeptide subunit release factors